MASFDFLYEPDGTPKPPTLQVAATRWGMKTQVAIWRSHLDKHAFVCHLHISKEPNFEPNGDNLRWVGRAPEAGKFTTAWLILPKGVYYAVARFISAGGKISPPSNEVTIVVD